MSSVINNLKKDESIFNKQLLIINSDNKKETETETSFTNTFDAAERVTKVELIDCNIPNTLYNVSNNNAIMNVDISLLNGNINNEKLIVSDTEIQNNEIVSSNIISGSVSKYNFITSTNLSMTDIKTQGLFVYSLGLFQTNLVSFYNTDNINPVSSLLEITGINNIFLVCYNIDQSFAWRLKITGDISYAKMEITDDAIYVIGKSLSNVTFYNTSDVLSENNLIMSTPGVFLCKYDFSGNLVWRLRCYQNDTVNSENFYLSISDGIYISSTFSTGTVDLFYDINDNLVESVPTIPVAATASFLIKYDLDGTYQTNNMSTLYNSNTGASSVIVTSMISNTALYDGVFIAADFDSEISFESDALSCNGDINICVAKYSNDIDLIGRIRIGGSSSDNNCILAANDDIYMVGNFTSNPVVFYNSNDAPDFVLENILSDNESMFFTKYPLTFIENISNAEFSTFLTSTEFIKPTDIKIANDLFISGNFQDNIKFYQFDGYVTSQDILSLQTEGFSQFVAKYDLDGQFIERIYNNNSNVNNLIDVKSSKLYSIGSFMTDNDYYNINDNIDTSLTKKENNNGVVTSYSSSNTGFILNYDILDNTIIFKELVSDEIGYFLNINAFAETLGFESSQKFIPSIFGNPINWQTLNINLENSTITINFSVANLETESFDNVEIMLTVNPNRYASYTPYNLIYELNSIFNTTQQNTDFLNQEFDAFYYDKDKNIFYVRIEINGTFSINDTNLSNSFGMNLQIVPYISQMAIISNNVVGDVNNDIIDNTKLTLKLRDSVITEVVNDVTFSEAFPLVASNTLTITADAEGSVNNISGTTELISDSLSNININDNITFEYPFLPQNIDSGIGARWRFIAISSDGKYQTATVSNGFMYTSSDSGNTWAEVRTNGIQIWGGVAVSSSGKYQTLTARNNGIYRSDDFGKTWAVTDSAREWYGVAMSSDGKIQTAMTFTYIYRSNDFGVSWNVVKEAGLRRWRGIAMSADGLTQTAVVSYGSIYRLNADNVTWDEVPSTYGGWIDVAMSSDGTVQTAVQENLGSIYRLNVDNINWDEVPSSSGNTWYAIDMDSSGLIQVACNRGDFLLSLNSDNVTWSNIVSAGSKVWEGIALSSDGIIQVAAASNNDFLYISTDLSISWNFIPLYTGTTRGGGLAISSNGDIQTAANITTDSIFRYNINTDIWEQVTIAGETWINDVAMSDDGLTQTIATFNGYLHRLNADNVTWDLIAGTGPLYWRRIAMSASGEHQTAIINGGSIYRSNDYGMSFTIVPGTAGIRWYSIAMSADGLTQTAVVWNGSIYRLNVDNITWDIVPDTGPKLWSSVAMSSDGIIQTATEAQGYTYRLDNNTGLWNANTITGTKNWNSIDMSGDGMVQLAVVLGGSVYKTFNNGDTWDVVEYLGSASWAYASVSRDDGSVQSTRAEFEYIYTNRLALNRVELTVKSISDNTDSNTIIIFNETPTASNNFSRLNGFNMGSGLNYTIKSIAIPSVEDIFITPGNYTIPEFIEQVNTQIHEINPDFYYDDGESPVELIEPFTYDSKTKKITFNPYFLGAEEDILVITDLLKTMGFTELPADILSPVTGQNVVNRNLSGSNNLYIKSDILGKFMKEPTISTDSKFDNVIASLGYDKNDDSYKLIDSNKNEIFLSQKIAMNVIDIKIIDDKSEIANLNGGRVIINAKLVKS